MSIDDVHSTFHLDLPFSLSSMVQEMGRSGRDGRRTENIILYNKQSASGQIANYANELQVVAIFLHHVPSRYAVGWGGVLARYLRASVAWPFVCVNGSRKSTTMLT